MEAKTQITPGSIKVDKSITIDMAPEVLYRFWRNPENIPFVIRNIKSVKKIDDTRSHWTARGPVGMKMEWDSKIINDTENGQIDWRSVEGSELPNSGSVFFRKAPGDRGTEVRVIFRYDPPGGTVGATVAKLFGDEPSQQIADGLRKFKQIMETGEIATIIGQPSGK